MRIAAVVLLLAACTARPLGWGDADAGARADQAAPADAGPTCPAAPPLCCTIDGAAAPPFCATEGGPWACPASAIEQPTGQRTCVMTVCVGEPLPAEICTAEGWRCDGARALMLCPAIACATCEGFTGPLDDLACACACKGGQVRCGASD